MGDNLVHCYNFGCGQKYNPDDNHDDACLHHSGKPKFHDAYKIWTCCDKKSTDFSTFLSYPGCTKGKHNSEKKTDAVRLVPQTEIRPEKEEVIIWNGLNKPDERPEELPAFMDLAKIVSKGLEDAVTEFLNDSVNKSFGELTIGTTCKNLGCKQVYNGPESNDEECLYHPGETVFHEGMKYYSCCNIKTTNFEQFLSQPGCQKSQHCWIKEEKDVKVKQDWFARNGYIHVNLYCKNCLPEKCKFETNGFELIAKISHGFGTKETCIRNELFGQVDPTESKVQLGERKAEIIMKQATSTSWPRLNYDTNLG